MPISARVSGPLAGGIFEAMSGAIIQVALDLPIAKLFDFGAADASIDDIGRLALVPFGNRKLAGVIAGVSATSDVPTEKLRDALHIQRALPKFSAADMRLFQFCADYYHQPLGMIALNALPAGLRATKPFQARTTRTFHVTAAGRAALETMPARAVAQRALLGTIAAASQTESALHSRHERAAALLKSLLAKELIKVDESPRLPRVAPVGASVLAPGPQLTTEQRHAVGEIAAALGGFAPFVLAGITGSGKTEVYLHLIAAALLRGQQALVLVPEINLTPQFLRQVAARFPQSAIVAQHSGLAGVARMNGFVDAATGRADIVVGTRLAVFTPLPRLGLIVVDEEHDTSFKQQDGVRYSARDVAVFRAREAVCPVVLGSATPSLESLHNVARGRFREIRLLQRASPHAVLSTVAFIDLDREHVEHGLSTSLLAALKETIARKEQALIFINRRGYAPALVCTQCGWIPACTHCSARLVLHQQEARLKCHHCGFQSRIPPACLTCGSYQLVPAGHGTERIESALQAALPDARIARVDRDSTRRRGSAEKIFAAAAAGEIDVLVGTQMLAKGHDFPRITLVGVINADGAMFSADFRAAERMVAQLTQVSGRAGRADLPGRVLIQTRFAAHPLYQAVARQDHPRFAEVAAAERRHAKLPPYSYLALLRAESRDDAALTAFMQACIAMAHELQPPKSLQVWDAVPAPLARRSGFTRQQIMLQSTSRRALQEFLAKWIALIRESAPRAIHWAIDVDPQEV